MAEIITDLSALPEQRCGYCDCPLNLGRAAAKATYCEVCKEMLDVLQRRGYWEAVQRDWINEQARKRDMLRNN